MRRLSARAAACALLAWLFAAAPGFAQQVQDEPSPQVSPGESRKQAPLLPLAEVVLFNTALSLFNRVFLAEPWTQVTGRAHGPPVDSCPDAVSSASR